MPRQYEIQSAFVEAIQLNPKGYRYFSTDSFIARGREENWHFTQADANQWINVISQTSQTRQPMATITDTGSCVTWGGYSDGVCFASY